MDDKFPSGNVLFAAFFFGPAQVFPLVPVAAVIRYSWNDILAPHYEKLKPMDWLTAFMVSATGFMLFAAVSKR